MRLALLGRAVRLGFTWLADCRSGPGGRALMSPRGQIYEFRCRPMALRRYQEKRFADAA